jgi:hypothetical protein
MTDLDATGGGSDDYSKQPKGNLDPSGQFFIWTSNMGGSRQDAFIVKVPSQQLVASVSDTTPPALSAFAVSQVTSGGATLGWTSDEPSDSQVECGLTSAYGSMTALDSGLVLTHARTPSGLLAGTLYHCRARSRDAAGNLAVSADGIFTTAATAAPPPASGPVGHWTLDETSGALAADSSGNGDSGTLLNGPLHIAGRVGQALSFNGVDEAVSIPHTAVLDTYPITISLWMSTTTGTVGGLVNKYLPSSFGGYQVFTSGGNLCAWYFRDASSYIWDGSGCTLATPGFNDGRWHHVAFIVDASGGRLFVDGTLRVTQPWTGTAGATTTTQDLSLARYPETASPYLPGKIDDVQIYNRALSAGEVSSLSASAKVRSRLKTEKRARRGP